MKKKLLLICSLICMLFTLVACAPVETIDYTQQTKVVSLCESDRSGVVNLIKTYSNKNQDDASYCNSVVSGLELVEKAVTNFASINVYVDTMYKFGMVNGITEEEGVLIIEQENSKIHLIREELDCTIKVIKSGEELEIYTFKFSQDKKDIIATIKNEGQYDFVFEYVEGKYFQTYNKLNQEQVELCLNKTDDEVVGFSFKLIINESGEYNSIFDLAQIENFGTGVSSISYNY